MGTDERWKKPKAERTQPVRNWSSIFNSAPTTANHSNSNGNEGDSTVTDPISRAVELGYRVVDEYIRQGQTAARRFSEGGLSVGGLTANFQDAATRMTQLTGEWMGLWMELAQRAVASGGMTNTPSSSPQPFANQGMPSNGAAPAQTTPPARVRLLVRSTSPTEAALDLHPNFAGSRLIVHSLRAEDPALPRITEVSFTAAANGEPAVVALRVPTDQPPGTYTAMLVDAATNRPAGTVSVRVVAADAE